MNDTFGIKMFVAYSDGFIFTYQPDDARRALMIVTFGD